MAYKLLYNLADKPQEHILAGSTTIGRSPQNQLTLTDFSVSRVHCSVSLDNNRIFIEDEGSSNGTFVNGNRVVRSEIKPGDEIFLGRFPIKLIRFDEPTGLSSSSTDEVILEEGGFVEHPGTIIKPMSTLFSSDKGESGQTGKYTSIISDSDIRLREKGDKITPILQILRSVAKTLISAKSLEEILDKVMELTFSNLAVERGFLLLYDNTSKQLIPTVVKHRNKVEDRVVISKTITEKVFKEQVSILTSDASIDPRFSGSESIIVQGIRSAMCVPLWNEGEVVGVLHVDSLLANKQFTSEDLDLLTALANYAAVGIQRTRLQREIQSEKEARNKLSRYHSPNVVAKIIASQDNPQDLNMSAQEHEVSILFSDIVGFTTISERLSAAEVAKFLNYYFTKMTEIIFEHEGTLDKFIGDAIMAVFGAPIMIEDHARRAVRAGLDMRNMILTMDPKMELGMDINLHVRIGVNTGTVIAGDIGSPQRMDYTVIGDTVNAASRIEEDIAAPDSVTIGEQTWKEVRSEFEYKEIGKFNLRGRSELTRCFEILRQK
jgi:adenylate cyclase